MITRRAFLFKLPLVPSVINALYPPAPVECHTFPSAFPCYIPERPSLLRRLFFPWVIK